MFLLIDEGMNWLFAFSAPPDRFPMAAHVRGFVGHAVHGVAVAVVAEVLLWLVGVRLLR